MAKCHVCFRHCEIEKGQLGFCGARTVGTRTVGAEPGFQVDGSAGAEPGSQADRVAAANYGLITALALDPIEKKPLRNFYPGSMILSVGSYGCNLRCPFCQNNSISWSEEALQPLRRNVQKVTPEELARAAEQCKSRGNIGIAFTYNEPLVGYEFVRDTAKLVREMGMKNVMVTNGTAEREVLEELLPWIDAMNIDLKGFDPAWYRKIGGDLEQTMGFIELAAKHCHVELTTLIIPGENDSDEMMEEQVNWIAGLTDKDGNIIGRGIPLHISRFFPQFHMTDRSPTDVRRIYELTDIAAQKLDHVYPGNC